MNAPEPPKLRETKPVSELVKQVQVDYTAYLLKRNRKKPAEPKRFQAKLP